jgi:biopolymer transport protein ExbD
MKLPVLLAKRRARIEIIPLIDIVFFLLAIFVMVSLSMVKNKGIDVNLPPAETGSSQARADQPYTAITVMANGQVFFNKERVSMSELPARLKALKKKEGDPTILLNGDEKAYLGKAIAILDQARKAGIKKIAVETKES